MYIFNNRLTFICEKEEVECDESTLNMLVEASGGDMRRAITCLQSCAKLKGQNVSLSINNVGEVTGVMYLDIISLGIIPQVIF